MDTRVLGVKWPGYRDFPEINLRFYVREKDGDRRGVVFVRELIKHRSVAWIARSVYNEPYVRAKIGERIVQDEDSRLVEYNFNYNGGDGVMRVIAAPDLDLPVEDSKEHWFKEHQWGFGTARSGKQIRYEVQHPFWRCHPVRSSEIGVDFGRIYGDEWASMGNAEPLSVVLAEGSVIKVFGACVY